MIGKKAAHFFKEYVKIEVRNCHLEEREKESIQSNIMTDKVIRYRDYYLSRSGDSNE